DSAASTAALDLLKREAGTDANLMEASIKAIKAGVTTGEWADALRETFGEYRPPTGMGAHVGGTEPQAMAETRRKVADAAQRAGVPKLRMLIAKPGLDGHSNAAEQVALRARDAGFEVVYQGIRLTPAQIANAAVEEDVHTIGISILSGAHGLLVPEILDRLRAEGMDPAKVPVIVGGVIPDEDERKLLELGVARVFTPKDFDLSRMIGEIADLIAPR
ncbi:MAG: ethylmalonyl-CoA mutase, partial [Actinomycetota bacterium]|nr:ethylmalonyl-CoA mutase [Actinomycetota bacterium]